MKELKLSGTIKSLDDLLFMCQFFDIEKAEGNKVTFSGEARVASDWRMAVGKIEEAK